MRLILISLMLFGCAERIPAPNPALQNETLNYTKDSDLKVIKESDTYKATSDYKVNKNINHIELPTSKTHHESVYKPPEPPHSKYSTHKEWVKTMTTRNRNKNATKPPEFNFEHLQQLKE